MNFCFEEGLKMLMMHYEMLKLQKTVLLNFVKVIDFMKMDVLKKN
jgi:hypothetical protein